MFVRLVWLLPLALALTTPAFSQIYKWVDKTGKTNFTDNLSTIPLEYLPQIEQKSSAPVTPVASPPLPSPPPGASSLQQVPRTYTVPLARYGNALVAQTVLNGTIRTPLLVDTGAELTVIAPEVAQRLGLSLEHAAVIPLRSASGIFLAPLVKVRSLQVGEATVRDVEVIIHDATPGMGGLLGMSFLDAFAVTINTTAQALTLATPEVVSGDAMYGGMPKSWWIRKFRFYRQHVSDTRAYIALQTSPQLERSLRYFEAELAALERQATLAAVPRHWRY